MTQKLGTPKAAADKLVKSIRRKTRLTYSAKEKINATEEFADKTPAINEMWQTDFTDTIEMAVTVGHQAAQAASAE